MTEMSVPGADGAPINVQIEGICGNCSHWAKNANGEIGTGVCLALPASIVLKGGALIKVRGNYNRDERGCTGLFTPRPDVLQTALAAAQAALTGPANEASPAGSGAIVTP